MHSRVEAFVIVRFHSGVVLTSERMRTQPESKPPLSGVQGLKAESCKHCIAVHYDRRPTHLAAVDWVMEWLPGLKRSVKLSARHTCA